MIQVRGLSKRFGTLQVLDGVDLTIRPGRVTAVVGPNGAGKTTLIKCVLGLVHPDAGTIVVDGVAASPDGQYRSNIGYMPQIARFPENLSAADLFDMMRDLRGGVVRDETLIESLGLRPHLHKPLRALSGGTRQKVNASLAFLFAPSVLIFDEPTSGLDPVSSGIVKDRILAERTKGRTCVLTSHVMTELEELADDIAFLVDGRIRFSGAVNLLKRITRQLSLERAIAQVMERGLAA